MHAHELVENGVCAFLKWSPRGWGQPNTLYAFGWRVLVRCTGYAWICKWGM